MLQKIRYKTTGQKDAQSPSRMQKDVHWEKQQQYSRIKAKRAQLMTSWAFNWYIKKHDINTTWNDEKSGKALLKGSSNVIDHKNHILHFIHVKLFDVWFSYYIA